jgi:cytochrome c oxidase subunit III
MNLKGRSEVEDIVEAPEKGGIDYTGKKIGMWIFLYTELLFFGGMFLLYSIFRSSYPYEFHTSAMEEDIVLGTINTCVLLTSSLFIALSIAAIKEGRKDVSLWLQFATIICGIVFLIIKYFEWSAKIVKGIYPDSAVLLNMGNGETLFFGLYYVMTGIHGLHVLIGIIVIALMLYFTKTGIITGRNFIKLENTGLYWHFVDIVWIYLFPLFYLVT